MALKFEYDKEKRTATVCGVEDEFCEQIVIPSAVEYYREKYDVVAIKYEAFKECLKLKSVTIPDSVTKIGYCAFRECSSLTSITIPDSVTEIEDLAFYRCSSLKDFKGKFAADNGRCLIKDGALIAYASASGTTYAIPYSVTKIGGNAFSGCSSLTSVTIPNGVTEIGGCAFDGCSSLKSVIIPDSVTVIERYAFDGCSSLTSVTIPDGVTEIGDWAFKGCSSLTSITIPDSVTYIGIRAFQYCGKLENVEICNDQGSVKIFYNAFGPDVKVTYLGKDAKSKK